MMVSANITLDEAKTVIIVQIINVRRGRITAIPGGNGPLCFLNIMMNATIVTASRIWEAATETSTREMHPANERNATLSGLSSPRCFLDLSGAGRE